jgi:hypothetical protein
MSKNIEMQPNLNDGLPGTWKGLVTVVLYRGYEFVKAIDPIDLDKIVDYNEILKTLLLSGVGVIGGFIFQLGLTYLKKRYIKNATDTTTPTKKD